MNKVVFPIALTLVCFCALSCEKTEKSLPTIELTTPTELVPKAAPGQSDASSAVVKFDDKIRFFEKRMATPKGTYLDAVNLFSARSTRYRLSGDLQDLETAKKEMEAARIKFKDSPPMLLSVATLLNTLHEVEQSRIVLDQAEKIARSKTDKSTIIGLRADADFQTGKLEESLAGFTEAYELAPSSGGATRISLWYRNTADFENAVIWADKAIEHAALKDAWARAFSLVGRGALELERGKLDDALAFYKKADDQFGGWFLAEEHIAEIYAEQGKFNDARALYEKVLSHVRSGQFYAALSGGEEELGNGDRAKQLEQKALAQMEADVKKLPAAMGGHALDIMLEIGSPARALELAKANHDLRPGFEAKVKLAQAFIRNGKLDEARAALEPVLKSKWNTVDTNLTAAYLFENAGDKKNAELYRQRAERIRPGSQDDLAWLKG